MATVNIQECEAAGIDEKEIRRIANGMARYAKQAEKLGLCIFGGAGTLSLRFTDDSGLGQLILAEVYSGDVSGGDGAENDYGDDLIRGEL